MQLAKRIGNRIRYRNNLAVQQGNPITDCEMHILPPEIAADPIGDSLHDMNVAQVLRLHCVAGGELGEVVLIGIEPADIALREGLSPELEQRLPAILQSIRNELGIPLEQERLGGTT